MSENVKVIILLFLFAWTLVGGIAWAEYSHRRLSRKKKFLLFIIGGPPIWGFLFLMDIGKLLDRIFEEEK